MDVVEDITDSLLCLLNLTPATVLIIRKVIKIVWSEIQRILRAFSWQFRNLTQQEDEVDPALLETTAENIQTILLFFLNEIEERNRFLDVFPVWEKQREGSIKDLDEIASNIKTSKEICSTVQIVGGSVGVIGGACIVASLLFPPAAFVLPVWLGGAAVTALIPSFLLPAAAATSGVAIGGGIAAAAGGTTQVVTSIAEIAILENLVKKAKEACEKDQREFRRMMGWFRSSSELESAFQALFGHSVVMESLFGDLARFCGLRDFDENSAPLSKALKDFVMRVMRLTQLPGCRLPLGSSPAMLAAVLSVVFAVFVVERRNRLVLSCIISVQKVGLGLATSLEAGVEAGRVAASAFVKSSELIPRAVARRVAVGLLAGAGIALDAANIALNAIDLAKGSKSVEQDKIRKVGNDMKEELETLQRVHRALMVFH